MQVQTYRWGSSEWCVFPRQGPFRDSTSGGTLGHRRVSWLRTRSDRPPDFSPKHPGGRECSQIRIRFHHTATRMFLLDSIDSIRSDPIIIKISIAATAPKETAYSTYSSRPRAILLILKLITTLRLIWSHCMVSVIRFDYLGMYRCGGICVLSNQYSNNPNVPYRSYVN